MKRYFAGLLSLLLILCVLPIQALAIGDHSQRDLKLVSSMIDDFEKKEGNLGSCELCSEVVEKDLENLYSIGLYKEGITISGVEDGLIAYQITFANEVRDEIRIKEENDGGLYLYITEGTIHDVVYFTNDMDIFVNGKEIHFVKVDDGWNSLRNPVKGNDGEASTMQANMRNVEWRSTPFTGYPYSAFKAVGTLIYPQTEITFNQLIKNMAIGTISGVLSAGITSILSVEAVVTSFLSGVGVSMAFDNVASQCRIMAQQYAPSSDSVLTSIRRHELKTNPVTNDIYYRYGATFELPEDIDGHRENVDFYYHNYFS